MSIYELCSHICLLVFYLQRALENFSCIITMYIVKYYAFVTSHEIQHFRVEKHLINKHLKNRRGLLDKSTLRKARNLLL